MKPSNWTGLRTPPIKAAHFIKCAQWLSLAGRGPVISVYYGAVARPKTERMVAKTITKVDGKNFN